MHEQKIPNLRKCNHPSKMAGNFNYPFINQFAHGAGGQSRHHDAGAGVAAVQYYQNPLFSQLNWMMQSQGVVHCKLA